MMEKLILDIGEDVEYMAIKDGDIILVRETNLKFNALTKVCFNLKCIPAGQSKTNT
jgi:hypothetical protein